MKYKHTITFINESKEEKLVEEYKDSIIDMVTSLVESNYDFDIDLKVIIKEPKPGENFVNGETNNGYSTMKGDSHVVCFTTESLSRVKEDRGLDLAIAINHELGHIYDLYHTMHNKYYKINPLLRDHNNYPDFVVSEGWKCWTEFHAYYFTFKEFYNLHEYPTFLQMVKGLKKLDEEYKNEIEPKLGSRSAEHKEQANNFVNKIEEFIYALAKHIAGAVRGKPKNYKYTEATKKQKEFKDMDKIFYGLVCRIEPMFSNTYGKGMARKLARIGNFLFDKIYARYKVFPVKHRGNFTFAFYK